MRSCPRPDYQGPCPYVSCRHHLWEGGGDPLDMDDTCVLDLTSGGGMNGLGGMDRIASLLRVSSYHARQILLGAVEHYTEGLVRAELNRVGVGADIWAESNGLRRDYREPARHLVICICSMTGEVIRTRPRTLLTELAQIPGVDPDRAWNAIERGAEV